MQHGILRRAGGRDGAMSGLEEEGHVLASRGMQTAARHQFRAAKVVMETVTPALGEERSKSSSTES